MVKSEQQTRSVFEQSLPIVAAALGRMCGVQVRFGSTVPATDGKTIFLPVAERQDHVKELEVLGILCHECGHVRFTDMQASGDATTFEHALDNALEDARIELQMTRLYPGAESMFKAAHAEQVKELAESRTTNVRSLILLFVLSTAEEKLLRRDWMHVLTDKLRGRMTAAFGTRLTEKIESLALTVRQANSTHDVVAIRKQIMALLKKEKRRAASSSQSVEAKAQEQSGIRKTHAKSGVKNDDASSSSGNGRSGQSEGADESEESSCGTAGRKLEALQKVLKDSPAPVMNPLDLSKAFKRVKAPDAVAQNSFEITGAVRPVPGNGNLGRLRLRQARGDSVSLRRALTGLVQSKAQTTVRIRDRGTKFSASHLARLAVHDPKVFARRECRQAPNTAVHILLDMSGSMGCDGGDLAVRSSLGLVLGLESIRGVKSALTIFPGSACGLPDLAVCPLLRHGERLSQINPCEIGRVEAWGGTPLYQALLAAGISLSACREPQKVLIVITDGLLSAPQCRGVLDDLNRAGTIVMGIQIGEQSNLGDLIPSTASVQSIDELKDALFVLAKKVLL